jgi:hypothetical protein
MRADRALVGAYLAEQERLQKTPRGGKQVKVIH